MSQKLTKRQIFEVCTLVQGKHEDGELKGMSARDVFVAAQTTVPTVTIRQVIGILRDMGLPYSLPRPKIAPIAGTGPFVPPEILDRVKKLESDVELYRAALEGMRHRMDSLEFRTTNIGKGE